MNSHVRYIPIFFDMGVENSKAEHVTCFYSARGDNERSCFIVQMVEFPVAGGGSTWHIMGGTLVTMILGPSGAIISSTIVLIIQALAFGDGEIISFGANDFNMAVFGAFSFFVVKFYRQWMFKQEAPWNSLIYSRMVVEHSDCFGCRY
jgi:hypothetical protein